MTKSTIAITVVALALLAGCRGSQAPTKSMLSAMGAKGHLMTSGDDRETAPHAFATVRGVMDSLYTLLDPTDPDSDLAKINTYAGSTRMPLAQDTYRLILLGLEHGEKMDGAFDITSQPLRALWGFGAAEVPAQPPSADLIQATLSAVGTDRLSLVNPSIAFESPETKINFGALSHGYAVDLSILKLRREGQENVYLSLANCARCLGSADNDRRWVYTIPHPRPESDEHIGSIALPSGLAVATARLYEETVTIAGVEYGHIIDPRTGYPAQHMQAVTVVGPTASEAVSLAESLVVLSETAGQSLLVRYPEYEALWIPNEDALELLVTEGFDIFFSVSSTHTGTPKRIVQRKDLSATYK